MNRKAGKNRQMSLIDSDGAKNHPQKLFSLLNDFVFKWVFGQEKHEQLAICLLNALLKRSGSNKIVSLEFLNPFNLKDSSEQKTSVVDVKVRDGEDQCYIIEVQVSEHEFFVPRTVYYLARLYSGQLLIGEDYSQLRSATAISILDFNLFKECNEMHNVFDFRNVRGTLALPETMVLHYIELKKFSRSKPHQLRTPFEKWLQVLKFSEKYITMDTLPDYLASEEGVAMAVSQLKQVNADREMRQILEAREKEARHVATIKKVAIQAGLEEGLAKGLAKGLADGRAEERLEIARKMLAHGATPEFVTQTTGLSEAELEKLIKP